jgi:hypothetical protein
MKPKQKGLAIMAKKWTLAAINKANKAIGHYFFDPETLKFFGETMACFAVSENNGRIFIERVKAGSKPEFCALVGKQYEFHPETGKISIVRNDESMALS